MPIEDLREQLEIPRELDIEMLVVQGSRERTATEYGELLNHSGYQLTRVVPTAGPFSLVEAKAV